jgi:eukaryotic-like serine/threonine-protein kinase
MNGRANITAAWLGSQFADLSNVQPLSEGGQKQVFSATHVHDGEVVLKLMHPQQDVARTNRELLAVAQIQSSRIPAILDRGTIQSPIGECFWFREKRILGQTVRDVLRSGRFPPTRLLLLGLHTLEVLAAAERANIVHRDVKPENIITDPAGEFWLIDFGLARHLGLASLTATAMAFGHVTWGYAPPEQCRNIKHEIDGRADLFAIGVTLYECATGSNPFRAGAADVLEILRRVETMPLPRLAITMTAASDFADLVQVLTQKRRDHRPRSVKEAYEWMKDVCDQQPI